MIVLENRDLRVAIDPETGGKIVSLIRKKSGREFLLGRDPKEPSKTAKTGDVFDAGASWGFDECVPTVEPCHYPHAPFLDAMMPDHGDLWSQKWEVLEETPASAHLAVDGVVLPYRFQRRVTIDGNYVVLNYRIYNRSDAAIAFNWTAHPLLAAEEGSQIALAGYGGVVFLPFSMRRSRFSQMWFGPRLAPGEHRFSVSWPSTNELLHLAFDGASIPYLGVWITEGGWPLDRPVGQYAIALEPSFAPSSLRTAIAQGTAPVLAPRAERTWSLRIALTAM